MNNFNEVRHIAKDAALFFLVSGGASLVYSKLWGVDDRSSGNLLFQLVSILIYVYFLYQVISKYKNKSYNILISSMILLTIIFYCLLSVFWAVEPLTSFRRSFALLLTSVLCIYISSKYGVLGIIHIIFFVCIYIAVTSLVAIVIPGWGIDTSSLTHSTAWRGLTGHKNDLGRYMALGVLSSYFLIKKNCLNKQIVLTFLILFLFILLKSGSKTPLVALIFTIASLRLVKYMALGRWSVKSNKKHHYSIRLVIFLIIFPIILFYLYNLASLIVEVIGKDLTFTGRTTIWNYALIKAEDRFFFGAGYRSFWVDKIANDYYLYNPYWVSSTKFANGHSGYIDVYVELGVIGLTIYFAFILSFIRKLIKLYNKEPSHECLFLFSVMIFFIIYTVTEQVVFKQSEFLWMIMMIVYFKISYLYRLKNCNHVN